MYDVSEIDIADFFSEFFGIVPIYELKEIIDEYREAIYYWCQQEKPSRH